MLKVFYDRKKAVEKLPKDVNEQYAFLGRTEKELHAAVEGLTNTVVAEVETVKYPLERFVNQLSPSNGSTVFCTKLSQLKVESKN